jgi:glycosyltransferase involved in cell wall biosynthesis
MKIVFIVHYFPPLNSTGARRILAFGKYLSQMGHEIAVITTAKSSYDGYLTEAMPEYCKVIELGGRRSPPPPGIKKERESKGRPWMARVLVNSRRSLTKIFGQLIDHRIFFALRFYTNRLPDEAMKTLRQADVLVSSNPPWPVHLAAYFAARKFKKPWVADYRDQFSGNHIFPGNQFSAYLEKSVEQLLLRRAAAITVVSSPMEDFYRHFHQVVVTIENGYDGEAFEGVKAELLQDEHVSSPKQKILRYLGTITRDRIPRNFLQAMGGLPTAERESLKVEFYGDCALLQEVIRSEYPELFDYLRFNESVPYREALRLTITADALLFMETSSGDSLSAKGVLTTKLFEYMAAQRPIVADISPDTLAGRLIVESGLGLVCSNDSGVIAAALQKLVTGDYALKSNLALISTFSREAQTRRF